MYFVFDQQETKRVKKENHFVIFLFLFLLLLPPLHIKELLLPFLLTCHPSQKILN